MKTYCISAYKPSSCAYWGSETAYYNSVFICEKHISRERLIQLLVEITSYKRSSGEDGYEQCEILESIDSENYKSLGDFICDDSEEFQTIRDEVRQIISEQKQAKELAIKQEEERQKENKRLFDEAQKINEEKYERALFEKLKEKYELQSKN